MILENYTVFLMFISEIIFVIVPAGVYILFHNNPIPKISVTPVVLMIFGYCTDGFITALVYWHVQAKKPETRVFVVRPT